jgi:preprotein translocase subunit SecG
MAKERSGTTIWLLLQLIGAVCLIIVVLTHVAESLHIFPAMGWGQPNSAGHYLDLVSAILAVTLLPVGFIGAFIRSKNSK